MQVTGEEIDLGSGEFAASRLGKSRGNPAR